VTAFDFALLGILGASVLLGLWRGVVSEVLALAAWVAAFFVARQFGPEAGRLLATWIADPALAAAAGFAAVVIAVLVLFGLGRLVVSLLLRAVGLGLVDRLLGGVFGVARGMLVALALVLIGGMTSLPRQAWWRDATFAPPLETAVIAAKPWLPVDVAKRIRFR
jgi:membrane protein required for colicin V production